MAATFDPRELAVIEAELRGLRAEMLAIEEQGLRRVPALDAAHAASARNLLHYVALRRRDLRPLQERLARLGLSSLGRCEANVLANVDAVIDVLERLQGRAPEAPATPAAAELRVGEGSALLHRHAEDLLGPSRGDRRVRVMVTMPSEAADDPTLVRALVAEGMDCSRINCAHDDQAAWARMIEHLRAADGTTRRTRVIMDVAGPKLRTGPLLPMPAVQRLRPERDRMGRVQAPGVAYLVAQEAATAAGPAVEPAFPVPRWWLARLVPGDRVRCVDARGSRRSLVVTEIGPGMARVESDQTVYVVSGLELEARRGKARLGPNAHVGPLAPEPSAIRLHRGDVLELTRSVEPGCGAIVDAHGVVRQPARIGCTLPEVFRHVNVGHRVLFDDGRLGGVIRAIHGDRLVIEICDARSKGESLGADVGINFPDSDLVLEALTEKDVRDLAFVARHADAVALSFVSCPEDLDAVREHLRRMGAPHLGIVVKIETRRAFERLPDLLLAAMQSPCAGVMIARGDLAVECGWERLAEMQEEILWFAEAAHLPVVWATQVLEGLAKNGRPSRAEITDAAMGERAECVMLNKGPHLPLAVRTLADILRRMQHHQQKKRSMLPRLHVAGSPPDPAPPIAGAAHVGTHVRCAPRADAVAASPVRAIRA